MTIVYIILGFLFFVMVIGFSNSASTKQTQGPRGTRARRPVLRLLNRAGDSYKDEWFTYIAGVNYHSSRSDIGGFAGWIQHDALNPADSRAMGIYGPLGNLIGYIPADELADYIRWCNGQPVPCVGFILREGGMYKGRVKALLPCNKDFIQNEFNRFMQWVNANYGPDYLPKTSVMNFDFANE